MQERQLRELEQWKREQEADVISNRPVATEEMIALPSDLICSPRLLPMKNNSSGNSSRVAERAGLLTEPAVSWEKAIERELRGLDFDKRVRDKFSDEGGSRLREGGLQMNISRSEKAPSPALNRSY